MINVEVARQLKDTVVIAAFEGWNDAGEAASDAVQHLLGAWEATRLATIDPEDYYDFQVNRPMVGFDGEGRREITWRSTSFWHCEGASTDRDIVLITGIEPNVRWRSFCQEVLDYVTGLNATTFIALGALLADVPHSRPVPVTGVSSDPVIAEQHGLEPSRYSGPTGIVGVLQDAAAQRGLTTLSFWAAVPHYVAQPPAPKAALALLGELEDFLKTPIELGALPEKAKAWERGVDELASDDAEVAEYVKSLEEERDAAELPQASGDAIAREFERYLRRRTDGD